jgi:hypothetical protein
MLADLASDPPTLDSGVVDVGAADADVSRCGDVDVVAVDVVVVVIIGVGDAIATGDDVSNGDDVVIGVDVSIADDVAKAGATATGKLRRCEVDGTAMHRERAGVRV